jgi:hypothetical protein
MAVVQLADIVQPQFFADYMANNSMTSTALYQSGVLVPNALMNAQLSQGGDTLNIPAWNDLLSPADPGGVDPNISTDDPTLLSTPFKINAVNQVVRKNYLNNSWGAASFAGEIAGSDPMQRIAQRVNAYWDRTYEFRLIRSLIGVLLSNVANNSSDMVVDISAATTGSPITINGTQYTSPSFNRNAVIDAAGTIGDRMSDFRAIAMHSAVYREASKNNEIEFVRDSDNNIMFATYAGMAVLQDDSLIMPSAGVYLTVLFGPGAVGFADGEPSTGFGLEVFRTPNAGNGGGLSTLYTRRNSIIHPLGFSFTGASVVGPSPSSAELATAANWTRIAPQRKQVPLCFLVTK